MNISALNIAQQWLGNNTNDEEIRSAIQIIEYLGEKLFDDYEPARGTTFINRLNRWVNNIDSEEDQITLLKLINRIIFIGRKEFDVLYKTAYNRELFTWLTTIQDYKIDDINFPDKIKEAYGKCWHCPITDSMRINPFYHVNSIENHNLRPHWLSLSKLGDSQKIKSFLETNKINYIILLEDFVGSGTQISKAIQFATEISERVKVLVIPLIICPKGLHKLTELEHKISNLTIKPVISLQPDSFITETPLESEIDIFTKTREIIIKTSPRVPVPQEEKPISNAFGFRKMGGLIVMYSNCPNNSIRILHYDGTDWSGLFPRSGRV